MRRLQPGEVRGVRREAVDGATLDAAREIVEAVRGGALRETAERFGDLEPGQRIVWDREALDAALRGLPKEQRELLRRTAARIDVFARAQREAMRDISMPVPGGVAGHEVVPVESAGCYAPGGRYPLPSSVLMTAVTARAAGVECVWVASPRPAPVTLAAAAVAGADALLAVGGAQAIAALAYGVDPAPRCDVIVGPGNRWVTAAKHVVSAHVRIDMLAGPSELVVLADASANAAMIAADLLAQAEHDPEALPVLVTTSGELADAVDAEIERQLAGLPTADVARSALGNGFAVVTASMDEAVDVCDRIAPEHLELHTTGNVRPRHFGALFAGSAAAEVFGDYGAGPNHVLPTGGTARFRGGLSVLDFLRVRTWYRADPRRAFQLVDDASAFARLEGLDAHARAAERRRC